MPIPLCLRSDGIFIAHVHKVCAVALYVGRRVASRFLLVRETAVGAVFLLCLFGHIELLHDLLAGCRMPDFLLVAVDDEVGRLRCLGSGGEEIVTEFFLGRLIFVRAGHAVETPLPELEVGDMLAITGGLGVGLGLDGKIDGAEDAA